MRSRKTYVTSAKYRRSGDFSRILEDFMKRAFLAIFCGAALLANSIAYADAVSDREMADRYAQAAQSGGFRAPRTKVIRMQCWFLPDSMPLGEELRTTT